jgi:hypothetical protein
VLHYADITSLLIELKTIGLRNAPKQGAKRSNFAEKTPIPLPPGIIAEETLVTGKKAYCKKAKAKANAIPDDLMDYYYEAFQILKDRLYDALTLIFLIFNLLFILYMDSSKERGYGTALY